MAVEHQPALPRLPEVRRQLATRLRIIAKKLSEADEAWAQGSKGTYGTGVMVVNGWGRLIGVSVTVGCGTGVGISSPHPL